jgi:hypothetical protein
MIKESWVPIPISMIPISKIFFYFNTVNPCFFSWLQKKIKYGLQNTNLSHVGLHLGPHLCPHLRLHESCSGVHLGLFELLV